MMIDILGIPYEVKEVNPVSDYENLMGRIDYLMQEILIKENLPIERKQEVLLHEVLHGIAEATGYGEEFNEKTVQTFARSLYSIFKANPTIFSLTVFEKEQNPQQF